MLVGLRTNEPAKGKWFVPGGVVRKYERLADAFARIVKAEIGLAASIDDAQFVGVYEHLYDSNVFWEEGFGTHYIVLAYQLNLDHQPPIVSDRQHSGFRWITPTELISALQLPNVPPRCAGMDPNQAKTWWELWKMRRYRLNCGLASQILAVFK